MNAFDFVIMATASVTSMLSMGKIAEPEPMPYIQHSDKQEHKTELIQISEMVYVLERNVSMFYHLAYHRTDIFDELSGLQVRKSLNEIMNIVTAAKPYTLKDKKLKNSLSNLGALAGNLATLFEAYQYKKEADKTISSRLYQGEKSVGLRVDGSMSREELRQALFSKRRKTA